MTFEFGKDIKEKINEELAIYKKGYETGILKFLLRKYDCCKYLANKYELTSSFFGWNGEHLDFDIIDKSSWEEIREAFKKNSPDNYIIESNIIITFWENLFYEAIEAITNNIKSFKKVLNEYNEFMTHFYYVPNNIIYKKRTWKDIEEYYSNDYPKDCDYYIQDNYYIAKQFRNRYLQLKQDKQVQAELLEIQKEAKREEKAQARMEKKLKKRKS